MMLDYKNKIIVAPMVKVSTLPFRLLCLDYGADLVYTEETIDFKMLNSYKKQNDFLQTVDFIDKSDGTIFFRTCHREKDRLIFQFGTCDPCRALEVAKLVEEHVAGIDINMGCPKEFSIKGGMGAALLTQPEKVKAILTNLTQNLQVPISCKIRILPTLEETLAICKLIESCGVAAIAVHGRTKVERPKNANHNKVIKYLAESLSIPVIANGGSKEIDSMEDIGLFKAATGASSVMIARAAMWNCSVLRREGKLPLDIVISEFLRYCIKYDNPFTCTKYTVQNILRDLQSTGKGKLFLETQTLQEICALWGLEDYFYKTLSRRLESEDREDIEPRLPNSMDNIRIAKREDLGGQIIEMPLRFIRGIYGNADLPKMVLHNYILKEGMERPVYMTEIRDKLFHSFVEVNGTKYGSLIEEKCRRYAEQGAALVCLHSLGLVNKTYGFVPEKMSSKLKNFSLCHTNIGGMKRLQPDTDVNSNKSQRVED